jgi:multiple sugar transport system permease protein
MMAVKDIAVEKQETGFGTPVSLPPQRKAKFNKMKRMQNINGTIMASIPFLGFLCFTFFPMIISLLASFTAMNTFNLEDMFSATRPDGKPMWIGFDNYIKLFTMSAFWQSVGNSIIYCMSVPLNMALALFLANLLTKKIKGTGVTRVLLFIPSLCSTVGVSLIWQWMYEQNGVINMLLRLIEPMLNTVAGIFGGKVDFPDTGIAFLSEYRWWWPCLLLLSLWREGTNIVLMQSALSGVDNTLKEAAALDGANERQIFWHITFIAITPTLFYMLTMNFLAAMQEMGLMQILAGGGVGPGNAAITLTYYQYLMSYGWASSFGLGIGSALGWVTAIFIVLVTRLQFWLSKKWVHYEN